MDPVSSPPDQPTRVFAVVNPIHPASSRAVAALASMAGRVTALRTTIDDPGPGQAASAVEHGADAVVVIGGDGTVRHVAGALAGTGIPLGIVPTGTANLFARNIGLHPSRTRHNLRTALAGRPHPFDLGWSRHRVGATWSDPEPFLVVAGIGNDAATVAATHPRWKRHLRWPSYLAAGLGHLAAPPFDAVVTADDAPPHTTRTWCVLAGNCGRLPAGIVVFPDARPDDGVLNTLVVPITRLTQWAPVAAKGLLRLRRDVASLQYATARQLTVLPTEPQPIHLDGDAMGPVDEVRWSLDPASVLIRTAQPWTTTSQRWNSLTSV